MKHDPLWIHGTCDRIMLVLLSWTMNYEDGVKSATNTYRTKPGELGPAPTEVEITMRRACQVPWNFHDLEYLIKILETKVPDWAVTKDLRRCLPLWHKSPLCPSYCLIRKSRYPLVGPTRKITIDQYDQSVREIYLLLKDMKDGKTKEARKDLSTVDIAAFE